MSWVLDNLELIAGLTLDHLRQSLLPIAIGLLISIPLGWVAFRFRLTRGLVLTVTGLLYTIPSLALFALLPPLLGISFLSELNLVVALTIPLAAAMSADRNVAGSKPAYSLNRTKATTLRMIAVHPRRSSG